MFWEVLQVVLATVTGLLVVPFTVWLLSTINEAVKNKRIILETELEIAKKQPPYDEVELSQPPNQRMFTLRLIKNKEVVFEESYDKDLGDE